MGAQFLDQISLFDYQKTIEKEAVKEAAKEESKRYVTNDKGFEKKCGFCANWHFNKADNCSCDFPNCQAPNYQSYVPMIDKSYGQRGCDYCLWWDNEANKCQWGVYDSQHKHEDINYSYPSCEGHASFLPSARKIPKMCANCKYSNVFIYQGEDIHNPIDEPNIYCTHDEGSLNRRTAYKDLEQVNFGVGLWNRQHEYDTCDRWELDRELYRELEDDRKTV